MKDAGNLYNEAMKNLAFTQIIIDCDTEDVDEKWKEAHRSELRELYPQHVGKVVTAQWYFEFFANSLYSNFPDRNKDLYVESYGFNWSCRVLKEPPVEMCGRID